MSKRIDTFVRDHMPDQCCLPERLEVPGHAYPARFNVTEILLDDWVAAGEGHRLALRSLTTMWTYEELQLRVSRYATALVKRLGLVPGNRVLLRGRNSPALAALHLAVIRAGGIVVSTMPMLRAGELQSIIKKAQISHAVCEREMLRELDRCRRTCPMLRSIATYSVRPEQVAHDASDIDFLARLDSAPVAPFRASADSPCLIAFTSGTTGVPKGAVHSHRDLLAICDTFSANILAPTPFDTFCGSPPLAFTYGLGGLLLFPLRVGASALLLEDGRPEQLLAAIEKCRPTICFTSATAYRMMLPIVEQFDIGALRACVSAGETLPKSTFDAFRNATGLRIIDGIGSTEMLHIFISAAGDDIRPGATGKVVPGFEATVLDEAGNEVPDNTVGWLAVRGPTGCRYLDDARQSEYVRNGWNVTGDAYYRDPDGYFWYQGRMDDLIVSSGYKVVPTEVEAALLSHAAVAECAVIGVPCARRGYSVKAFVVLAESAQGSGGLESELCKHAKAVIAPYKAPREITFVPSLPKTPTGKVKRFALRQMEPSYAL
jgi:2-aminobenzoate-CoA ligase